MAAPSILYIGLTPDTTFFPKGIKINHKLLHHAVERAIPDCIAAGFDTELCVFEPHEIGIFESKLKERTWDAVIIGFGVRGQPVLTPHFERIVNMIREHDPNIKLGFNSYPSDTVDAAKRLFPNVKPLALAS